MGIFRNVFVVILFHFFLSSTSAAFFYDSDKAQLKEKITASVFSEMKIYELGTNTSELRSDWGKEAQELVEKILAEELGRKAIKLKKMTITKETEPEWDEIKPLYQELSADMIYRKRFPHQYNETEDKMYYSVGSVENVLKDSGADYILYIEGFDCISTTGRKASKAAVTVLGALVGVIPTSWGEITYLDMAIIDARGKIVWHSYKFSEMAYDLRDYDSTQTLIREMLNDLDLKKMTKPVGNQQSVKN